MDGGNKNWIMLSSTETHRFQDLNQNLIDLGCLRVNDLSTGPQGQNGGYNVPGALPIVLCSHGWLKKGHNGISCLRFRWNKNKHLKHLLKVLTRKMSKWTPASSLGIYLVTRKMCPENFQKIANWLNYMRQKPISSWNENLVPLLEAQFFNQHKPI